MQQWKKWLGLAVVVCAPWWPATSVVAAEEVDAAVAETILDKLETARPDFDYGEVYASPMPGIYQVQVNAGPLLYTTADGNFVLTGQLYGVTDQGLVDVRDLALQPVRAKRLRELDTDDMIVFPAAGERKAHIYVFTDVDCGYCQKLHWEVPELNELGIEVRYLAYPRAGVGSGTYDKMVAAWCGKNPRDLLTRLKSNEAVKVSDSTDCEDNPIAAQYQLGNELGVRGTPAIVLADGTMIPGYVKATVLAERLGL